MEMRKQKQQIKHHTYETRKIRRLQDGTPTGPLLDGMGSPLEHWKSLAWPEAVGLQAAPQSPCGPDSRVQLHRESESKPSPTRALKLWEGADYVLRCVEYVEYKMYVWNVDNVVDSFHPTKL